MRSRPLLVTSALVRDTFREASSRMIFWGLFGLSTLMILFFLFIMKIDIVEGALATVTLFGQSSGRVRDINMIVRQVHSTIATFLYTWGMLLSVFAAAGLIPSLLEPGRIELLVSKPVRRSHLLLGRYLGATLVVSLNIAYLVLGVWTIFGWKTGDWSPAFLWTIATTVFVFAVLLSAVVLVGVLIENAAVATMVAAALMILSPILAQTSLMERLLSSEWTRQLWKGLYHMLPKVYDMGVMTLNFVRQQPIGGWTPVWSSALFAAAALLVALVIFSRRDY